MLLIAAALAEELETALNLCNGTTKSRIAGVPIWTGKHQGGTLSMVKLGTGPARSAATLERALSGLSPEMILVVGYAGALDPALHFGDLVVIDRAHLVRDETWGAPLGEVGFGEAWPLAAAEILAAQARNAGLPVHCGTALTARCIIGDPAHKRVLFERFQAAVVDMETAALAPVAASAGIPFSCVRAISDEAGDDLFAAFSYDPRKSRIQSAAQTLAAGNLMLRVRQWRERSRSARDHLTRFLAAYLRQGVKG